jgi:hypothetical protein
MKLPNLHRRTPAPLVAEDAAALIAAYGESAYGQARTWARDARLGRVVDGNRPRGHWDSVRREIARITGRQNSVDTAIRYLEP